jgi:hypothetical protein
MLTRKVRLLNHTGFIFFVNAENKVYKLVGNVIVSNPVYSIYSIVQLKGATITELTTLLADVNKLS